MEDRTRIWDDLLDVPPDATGVIIDALETFGTFRKAVGWLSSPCPALGGEVPLRLVLAGQQQIVEAELDLIRDGAFI